MSKQNRPILIAAGVIMLALVLLIFFGGTGPRNTFRPVAYIKNENNEALMKDAKRLFCPRPSAMKFDGTHWRAPGGWKTIDKPLTKQVGSFKKAQWQGVNLGEVICQYGGRKPSDFPINLQRLAGKVVLEPQGSTWTRNSKSVKTCTSNLVTTCPFYEKAQADMQNYDKMYRDIFE